MILLDTNVVSELIRSEPAPQVVAWADTLDPDAVGISAVSLAVLERGVALLPAGRRRRALKTAVTRIVNDLLGGRVLPFDRAAAEVLGERLAPATAAGRPPSIVDAFIAATALAHGATMASRDVAPFAAMGVPVVDPWHA